MTWARDGRGRSFEFRLETDALIAVLAAVAQEREDEFRLLQCQLVQTIGHWESVYEALAVEELAVEGPWKYFVQSRSLTPVIPAPSLRPAPGWDSVFSVNGLISLYHPDPGCDAADPPQSRIGIVHRVANVETGETIEHVGYDDIFRKLKATVRRALT